MTTYLGGFVYQNDKLQLFGHEEGRIRPVEKVENGQTVQEFIFDYFLKDHLGNVRMVLTEERETNHYMATMELPYRQTEEYLFDNIYAAAFEKSSVPGDYPADPDETDPNDFVARVNGSDAKIGPAIVLRVMGGDKVDIGVKSLYREQGPAGDNSDPVEELLYTLASGIVGSTGGSKGSHADLSDPLASPLLGAVTNFRQNHNPDPVDKPKAFLNWILFDEQFRYVGTGSQSGAIPVTAPDILQTLSQGGIEIAKNGFLYIYVSNETENWNVFFDNLSVKHYKGPLVEETHYYPFGLTMAGISSKALKGKDCGCDVKKGYNGNELQHEEFSDGSGLEMYDFNARTYDQQIGRFIQIDPIPNEGGQESLSPYHFGGNNPIRYNDPDGECPWCIGAIVGAIVEYGTQVATNLAQGKSLGESLTDVDGTSILIAAGTGALSGGTSAFIPKGTAGKILKEGVEIAIDPGESALQQYNENGTVSFSTVVEDVAVGKVGGKLTENVKVHSDDALKTSERQLDRAERVAAGDPNSSGRAAKVEKAQNKLDRQSGANQAASQGASGAASNGVSVVTKAGKGNRPRLVQPTFDNRKIVDGIAPPKKYIPRL